MASYDIQTVRMALRALHATDGRDPQAMRAADEFLTAFQTTPEAWPVINDLLSPNRNPALSTEDQAMQSVEAIFAAQSFRVKISRDLHGLPRDSWPSLRATLLAAAATYATSLRAVRTQLCLAVVYLAVQDTSWMDVVPATIKSWFNPDQVVLLLEFLTVLPQELCGDSKFMISEEEYGERAHVLLTQQAQTVLSLLTEIISSPTSNAEVRKAVFRSLKAWLAAGEFTANAIARNTPFVDQAIQALTQKNMDLFDEAIEFFVALVHETQELEENREVVGMIIPQLVHLRQPAWSLIAETEDDDVMRAYCRLYVEAGEVYHECAIRSPELFLPILEAILACTQFDDLAIVKLTFPFWQMLTATIQTSSSSQQLKVLYSPVYSRLLDTMISHLRYPGDDEPLVGEELYKFRDFRHVMGRILKNCCTILGSSLCLERSFEKIQQVMAAQASGQAWQPVEAALFAMRSMGAEVDATCDNTVIPQVFALIPTLPQHQHVQYASLLFIGRYTEWIAQHTQYIPFVLERVSKAFASGESSEVYSAASQALRYLCKDSPSELAAFLPSLNDLIASMRLRADRNDILQLTEAVAHVIGALPASQYAEEANKIVGPLLEQLQASGNSQMPPQKIIDALDQIEVFLSMLAPLQASSSSCTAVVENSWPVIQTVFTHSANSNLVAERLCALIRRGIAFFNDNMINVVPSIISSLLDAFRGYNHSCFLWVLGKTISQFHQRQEFRVPFRSAIEQCTNKVTELIRTRGSLNVPDVIEDYVLAMADILYYDPNLVTTETMLPQLVDISIQALTLPSYTANNTALELLRDIAGDNCLYEASANPPKASLFHSTLQSRGAIILQTLFPALLSDLHMDCANTAIVLFKLLCMFFPRDMSVWVPALAGQLVGRYVTEADVQAFLQSFATALSTQNPEKAKNALQALHRTSQRSFARMNRLERQN